MGVYYTKTDKFTDHVHVYIYTCMRACVCLSCSRDVLTWHPPQSYGALCCISTLEKLIAAKNKVKLSPVPAPPGPQSRAAEHREGQVSSR